MPKAHKNPSGHEGEGLVQPVTQSTPAQSVPAGTPEFGQGKRGSTYPQSVRAQSVPAPRSWP
ncbi:MAG: hypothetical protein ACLS5G_00410 [Streptococcus sp.]